MMERVYSLAMAGWRSGGGYGYKYYIQIHIEIINDILEGPPYHASQVRVEFVILGYEINNPSIWIEHGEVECLLIRSILKMRTKSIRFMMLKSNLQTYVYQVNSPTNLDGIWRGGTYYIQIYMEIINGILTCICYTEKIQNGKTSRN